MRILGIDPSYTACGLAIIEDGQLTWHQVVKTSSTMPDGVRLEQVYNAIKLALHEGSHDGLLPVAAIEGYAMGAKFRREQMGEVGGAIKLALSQSHVYPAVWPPKTWRKVVLADANVAKDQVRLKTFQRYGVDLKDHNALEAFCVAMAEHLIQTGLPRPRPKKKREPIEEAA